MAAVPRIGICGAGISGLTLAGILSRKLGPSVSIRVLERGSIDRDQGYGLDLDEYGQLALVRAGVYNRFWEMAKPKSDIAGIFPIKGDSWCFVFFRPRFLMKMFPSVFAARPECNRGMIRDVFLDALKTRNNTEVLYNVSVRGLRGGENGAPLELLDHDSESLGEFDLVIDAMGLHSTIRQHRVIDPAGQIYSDVMMIHGMISDPSKSFTGELLDRVQPFGTTACVANGVSLFLQKYGAGVSDNRTSLFYVTPRPQDPYETRSPEAVLLEEIGVPLPNSRESGIVKNPAILEKYKAWLKKEMEPIFDPLWLPVIDCLERITVRGIYYHGHETKLNDSVELPLVCIGDSMRNCGLGGGGILAMRDAIELSEELLKPGAFDPKTRRPNLSTLRATEENMMARKTEFHKNTAAWSWIRADKQKGTDLSWGTFFPPHHQQPWKLAAFRYYCLTLRYLFGRWYEQELASAIPPGSDPSSPIYPMVRKALQEEDSGVKQN